MTRLFIYLMAAFMGCIISNSACAEKAGSWRLYQSFNKITEIAPAGNTCFALASNSLFAYNTTTGEINVYDKTNSLSDNNISHIKWNKTAKRLVIVYANSNIDLLAIDGGTINVPDLYMKTTTKDKTVNHIYIDGTYAYVSLGFGVMKLDVRHGIIADTYQLDFNVNNSYTKDGYLYAASMTNGTYRGKMTDNLLDKSKWQRVGEYTALSEDLTNVQDATTNMWWTCNDEGKLTYYSMDNEGNREYKTEGVLPDGPASNRFYRLYMHNQKLYATGGVWTQETDGGQPGEVHVWDGNSWGLFEQPTAEILGHRNEDYICMDFDPLKEGHVMVGAKTGLYEFQDGKFVNCYNTDNSPIESSTDNLSKNYAMATSVRYSSDGNLWVLNRMSSTTPLLQLSKDETWKRLNHAELKKDLASTGNLVNMYKSQYYGHMLFLNNYWEVCKLYAYDTANDKLYVMAGPTFTNEDGATITPIYIHGMTEDHNGNIWLATTSGPLYLTPADVQAGNGSVTQHKVPRNDGTNLADYLLANVNTRCIAVDGGNRKWIGTDNGVFLISDDCDTQLQHFTTENSPLPSDVVYDICVDQNSNNVYFATVNGLCSYASDATAASEEMTKDNVYAYPNPVSPDYTGKITIVGLTINADVKIVTSNGTLVNQGRSTGGSYHWDGRDMRGKRVASGVYMVEAAKADGSKGTVCKIAIIN